MHAGRALTKHPTALRSAFPAATCQLPHARSWWVLSKGAPEVMQGLLAEVPPHYQQCYKVRWRSAAPGGSLGLLLAASSQPPQWLPAGSHPTANPPASPLPPNPMQHYASEGARVLALAYKQLDSLMTPSELRHLPRDSAESKLTFAGAADVQIVLCVVLGEEPQPAPPAPRSGGEPAHIRRRGRCVHCAYCGDGWTGTASCTSCPAARGGEQANSFGRACCPATTVLHMCGLIACSRLLCSMRRAGLPQQVRSLILVLPHILPAPAGFAIFRSPLKEESEPALRMLRESQHQLVMITGGWMGSCGVGWGGVGGGGAHPPWGGWLLKRGWGGPASAVFAGCHSRVLQVAPVGCDERVASLLACWGGHLRTRRVG